MAYQQFEKRAPDQPIIYVSAAGWETFEMSYSMAGDMSKCGKYVDLSRVQGYKQKREKAAMHLGKVTEAVVAEYYKMGGDPVSMFTKEWSKCKNWSTLEYSAKSSKENWEGYLWMGEQWMAQLVEKKEMYAFLGRGIFGEKLKTPKWHKGSPLVYIADWHSKEMDMSKLANSSGNGLLIDIKCTGAAFTDDPPNLYSLDNQLCVGALVSGIRNVAFVNFVRGVEDPRIQMIRATINDERIVEVDAWLKDQYDHIVASRFYRTPGARFPDNKCTMCDMLPICTQQPQEVIDATLTRKESKQTMEMFHTLDQLD